MKVKNKTTQEQFKLDVKQNYIHVTVSGTFSLGGYKTIFDTTLSECIKNNKSIILFDLRTARGEPSVFERYDLAVYFAEVSREHPITFKVKVALAGYPPLIDPDRFGEKVAQNRGVNVKVTTDYFEAIKWLQVDQVSE